MLETLANLAVSPAQAVIAVGMLAAAFCYSVGIYSAEEFFGRRKKCVSDTKHEKPQLGLSLLRPLKGLDPGLYENLASLCRQDYPHFQIICGVADAHDPAASVVRKLQRDFPHVDLNLVIDDRVYGANYKVSNLINMLGQAEHEVIVIADGDIRVGPGYLDALNEGVQRPNAGLATCLYRAVNRGRLPTLVEALFINTDFTPLVMLARKVERSTYAFGATIAIHREILDEIGGFAPLANTLADDYQLGYRVAEKGYDLILLDEVVDTILAVGGWRRLIDHQLRWARTYRICRPGGYFGSVLTHGTLWALLNAVYNLFSPLACFTSSVLVALRYASAMMISWRHLKTETPWSAMLLVPFKDLFFDLIWLLAFAGDTVLWGGHRFRVDRNGEMVDLDAEITFSEIETSPQPKQVLRRSGER